MAEKVIIQIKRQRTAKSFAVFHRKDPWKSDENSPSVPVQPALDGADADVYQKTIKKPRTQRMSSEPPPLTNDGQAKGQFFIDGRLRQSNSGNSLTI